MEQQLSPPGRFEILDGLRGIAALLVIISHCANAGILPRVLGQGVGQMGVMLFFALSGFLMTYLYLGQPFDRVHVVRYARNRAGRVLPLYFLMVGISLLPPPFSEIYPVTGRELEHLLLIRGVETLWTIPVEVHFYAAFVILWWSASQGRFWMAFAAIGSTMATLALLFSLYNVSPQFLPFWMQFFLIGVAAAVAWRKWHERLADTRWRWFGWAACLIFLASLPELRRMAGIPVLPNWIDPITGLAPMLLFGAAVLAAPPLGLLSNSTARFVGAISYGLYLIHYPVLKVVMHLLKPETTLDRAVATGCVLGVTIALASLSYRLFELPAQRLVRSAIRSRA